MSPRNNGDSILAIVKHYGKEITTGTFIPPEAIEHVTGIDRNLAKYSLKIMGLRKALEAHLEAMTGRRFMTRMSNCGIRVLTTSEAATHSLQSQDNSRSRMDLWHHRGRVCVDPYLDDLSSSEKKHYQAKQEMNSRILLHMKEVELRDIPEADFDDPGD